MRVTPIKLVFTLLIISVVSTLFWVLVVYFSYAPLLKDPTSYLVIAILSSVFGVIVYIGGKYFDLFYFNLFYFEEKGFSLFERIFTGRNGKLFGEIYVGSFSNKEKIYEVFYTIPYIRSPNLKIRQKSGSYEIIEQRNDGFKIKADDIYHYIWWKAEGTFADLKSTPSFSSSIFGLPNKKYTYDLFVLMPFTSSLKPVYDEHIKKVAKTINLSIARADDFFSHNSIMYEVWSAITQASVLIADCTGKNPNVFYEIGIAHAIGKPVILITQNPDDVPFDIRHIRYINYEYTPSGMIKFENTLTTTILEILKDNSQK